MTAVTLERLSSDPHPLLRELRAAGPVSWVDVLDAWLVTGYQECARVMLDPETYTVDDPRFSTQRVIGPSMLSLDGSEHRRHRDPFSPHFRTGRVARLEENARDLARRQVGHLCEQGGGDLRRLIAAPLAVAMMSETLDLDNVSLEDLLAWYGEIVDAVHVVTGGGDVPESGHRALSALERAVVEGSGDSVLLGPIAEAGQLSVGEIVSNVGVLLFGGIVTAESSTSIAFRYLLEDPSLFRNISADRSLVAVFAEETLRLEPSAAAVDRYATRDTELGGVEIAAGDLVRVSLSAANRDPDVFPDPDLLDLGRSNTRQNLTFARGPHACLGVHLARLEIIVAVEALLEDAPALSADSLDPIEGLVFRAPRTVRAQCPGIDSSHQ